MRSGDPEIEQEPGYFLGITLIAVLVGFNVAVFMIAPTFPPPSRGPATILTGVYLIFIGLMFLASYYYSHKTFVLRGLMWVCENFSNPRGRKAAFVYFALATVLGVAAILTGLGVLEGRS